MCGKITDGIIKYSMQKKSVDNVSVIFIAFKNFENKMKDPDFEYKNSTKVTTIKDKYVGVDINYYGKLIHVFIYADSQLYCQVEYDNNLPDEERLIAETPVMNLSDILTNKPNKTQLWKYFNRDDVEGVYNCFLKVIERCIKS